MKLILQPFVLIAGVAATLYAVALNGQHSKANSDPPAVPQAKTPQPATHFTQGTIASIDANQVVITKKVRGKEQRVAFAMNSQTLRSGTLITGARVTVQYHEADHQNVAAAVRELPTK